ncbi:hypothetical protein ACFVVL_21070 [Kitasatospora sp. NPDC058115]|uniref:hypothetical protein n=1 Tax=Kitasatospora sp. NPDC058115 TaxID=3346347 RepID=UPI0036DB2679
MRIHRSAHVRNFTVLPNFVLQYRKLSYTARGLLADLLSRPDGWREDGRHMADTSPQGRGAVRKALKELTDAGYYHVEKIRLPDGTLRSEAHVYDTPQLARPGVTLPASGGPPTGGAGSPVVKDRCQEPTLPSESADDSGREAVDTLFRVIRAEPRLRLGEAEARELAPLVGQWLARGCTAADLAHALLPGLPAPMHSAAAVLRYRLEHKMPPCRPAEGRRKASYVECGKCHDPVPAPGICRACAGLVQAREGGASVTTARGVARARAALLGTRAPHVEISPSVATRG